MHIFVLLEFLGMFIVFLKMKRMVYISSLGIKVQKHYMQHDSLFSHVLQFINSQDYLLFFILKGKEIKSRSQTRNSCCPVLIPERMRLGGQVAFIQGQSQQLVKIAAGEFCSTLIGSTSLAAGANLILTEEQNCLQAMSWQDVLYSSGVSQNPRLQKEPKFNC